MLIFLYTDFRNSSISDEHVFFVALHFTTGLVYFLETFLLKIERRVENSTLLHLYFCFPISLSLHQKIKRGYLLLNLQENLLASYQSHKLI